MDCLEQTDGALAQTAVKTQMTDVERHRIRISPFARQIILICAISAQWSFDLWAIPIAYASRLGDISQCLACALFGSLLGQLAVLANYLAWGPGNPIIRWAKSCSLVVIVWHAITIATLSCQDSFEVGSIEQLLAVVVAAAFVSMSIPYWLLRVLRRSRLERVQDDDPLGILPWPYSPLLNQLAWMAVLAMLVVISLSKAAAEVRQSTSSMSGGDWISISLWMSLWAASCVLLTTPIAWVCLSRATSKRQLFALVIYTLIVVGAECAILRIIDFRREWYLLASMDLGIIGEAISWSLILRFCGFRRRRPI